MVLGVLNKLVQWESFRKKMTKEKLISQNDLKFWIPIVCTIAATAVAFATLNTKVEAMVDREQANKHVFEDFVDSTTEKLDKIIGNQLIIATELGIKVER